MTASQLFFVWQNFTGRDFDNKIRNQEITKGDLYEFLTMAKEFQYKQGLIVIDLVELRERIERLMIVKFGRKV